MTIQQVMPYLLEVFNVFIEIFIVYFYISRIFEKADKSWKMVLGTLFAVAVACIVKSLFRLPTHFNVPLTCLIYFGLAYALFQGSIMEMVYSMVIYAVIIYVTDTLTTINLSYIFDAAYETPPLEEMIRPIGMLMTDFIKFLVASVAADFFKKKMRKLPMRYWIFIVLCPLFSFGILVLLDYLMIKAGTANYLFVVIPVVGLMYVNVAVFNFFDTYYNQLKLGVMEEMAERNAENYKLLQSTEDEIRILRHDIKNHIGTVTGFLAHNQIEEARDYMQKLSGVFDKVSSVVYTQNNVLDAILNIKGRQARAAGKRYIVKVGITEELKIDPVALSTILNNALDNAIEGCGGEDPYILVSIQVGKTQVRFLIENSTTNEIKMNEERHLITTKSDARNHGFGLKSIRRTAREHGGEVYVEYQNTGVFGLNIVMENKA